MVELRKGSNILVTGGAGYVGSHTCKMLSQSGYQPVVLDNLVYGHEWAVKWGPLEVGDISDSAKLREVFEKYEPSAVMHFSAYAYVGESVIDPAKYYMNNVGATLTLIDAMRQFEVDTLVFSSSCATYGIPDKTPIVETQPQNPINPYGASKLFVERILRDYGSAYGFRSASLRYFNAAGADPDGEIGEDHDPETHLIPLLIDVAAGRRQHIEVYGTDYPTPDGTAIRDYVHVNDLGSAHILALEYLANGGESCALNLGVGNGSSVKEVISSVERVCNTDVPVKLTGRRAGDPAILVAKASLAAKVLSWEPKFTSLDSIVETAVNWHERVQGG